MSFPKIDLVIPLYNKKKHIKRCIDSATDQYKKEFNKIIIINDGSTDGVENILKSLESKYSNLKVLNQNNKGVSEARNEGIRISKANYIVFLDADDELNKYYLHEIHRLILKFKNSNVKVFSTTHKNVYKNDNNSKEVYFERKSNFNLSSNPLLNISFNKSILCASGVCIKKDLINKNLFPKNIKIGEDIYVWEKILLSEKLAWSNQKLITVYKNAENRAQDLNKDVPFYILQYKNFYKEIKYFNKKIAFNLFHILSLFIIINQFNNRKILDEEKFKIIYQSQNLFNKILSIIFKSKIFHFVYNAIVLFRKIINQIKFFPVLIYLLITPTAPIIFLILFFKNQNEFSSLFLLYSSFISILIFFSSLQSRIYLYNSYPKYDLNYIITYRLMCSIFIYIFSIFLFLFFFGQDNFYLFLFCINSLLLFWFIEINLLRFEKFSNIQSIKNLLLFVLIYYSLIIFVPTRFDYYFYISFAFVFTLIFFSFVSFSIKKKYFKFLKKKILAHYAFYFFWSGILFSLSNYAFRFILTENINLTKLSYYFLIFSITTLPSTLYYAVVGQYSLSSKYIKNLYFIFIHIILLITFIFLNYHFKNFFHNSEKILIISFLSSILLLQGHIFRAKLISFISESKNMLSRDFLFFLISGASPIIIFISEDYMPYLLLINGVAAIAIFSINPKKNYNEEN